VFDLSGGGGRVEPSQFEAATPSVKPEKSGWGVEINPPSYISDNWIGALLVRLHFVSFRRWLFVAKHSADADTHNFVERLAASKRCQAIRVTVWPDTPWRLSISELVIFARVGTNKRARGWKLHDD
jgi:hypothetical protein